MHTNLEEEKYMSLRKSFSLLTEFKWIKSTLISHTRVDKFHLRLREIHTIHVILS